MSRTRGIGFWAGLLGVLLVAALVVGGGGRSDGPPLDPRSTGPLGARALVLLLEDLGATVEVGGGIPVDPDITVLLLRDNLSDAQHEELEQLVRDGAVLVVADTTSPFAAPVAGTSSLLGLLEEERLTRERCDIDALDDVGELEPGAAYLLAVRRGAQSCFGDGGASFVVVDPLGDGAVVSLGGAGVLTNEQLGEADGAVLAAALLAPSPGGRVVLPEPVLRSEGDQSFIGLATEQVGPGLPYALLQVVVAFVVYALLRARRLGRPVSEPQPVQIAGSELTLAVGRLLAQAGSPDAAAALARRRLRFEVAQRRGLSPDSDAHLLVDAVAPFTDRPRDDVYRAVADLPVADDAELLELIALIDGIRQEVLHGGSTPTAAR